MTNLQTTFTETDQPSQSTSVALTQTQPTKTTISLPDGDTPVSIIIAISVLIGSIGGLIKGLLPAIVDQPDKKTR